MFFLPDDKSGDDAAEGGASAAGRSDGASALARRTPPVAGGVVGSPTKAVPARVLNQIAALARRRVLGEFATRGADDLGEWVGSWFADAAVRDALAEHVTGRHGVARVRDFLAADVAASLHEELVDTDDWDFVSEARPKYQYSFLALSDHGSAFFSPRRPTLRRLYGLLNGPAVKRWAEHILREPEGTLDADTTVMATEYRPGVDYTSLHSDAAERRRLAFVLHLAQDWRPEFGGDLVFVDPVAIVHPEYNTLNVFKVGGGGNWHMVTPVVPATPARRFAITGWFNSSSTPAAQPAADAADFLLSIDPTKKRG